MEPGRRQIFVYYRLASEAEASAVSAVLRLQAALMRETPGLVAQLLRRPAEAGTEGSRAVRTVMETYAMDARVNDEGVSAELQALIEARMAEALAAVIDGARHVEVFERCV